MTQLSYASTLCKNQLEKEELSQLLSLACVLHCPLLPFLMLVSLLRRMSAGMGWSKERNHVQQSLLHDVEDVYYIFEAEFSPVC